MYELSVRVLPGSPMHLTKTMIVATARKYCRVVVVMMSDVDHNRAGLRCFCSYEDLGL
tara:strand:+ start:981 stop:1154 length:174 start_codon:yes stop_codon:yes gene_type:complete